MVKAHRVHEAMRATRPIWLLLCLALAVALPSSVGALKPFGKKSGVELQGRFRALLIGVQAYDEWQDLSAPHKDVARVAAALGEHYLFEAEDIVVLRDPTQAQMFTAIKEILTSAGEHDSLLIFFAGHGHLEKATGGGYWIPADGKRPGPASELSYLSSAWVRDVVRGSPARHVAIVSDACFSGSLLTERAGRTLDDTYYGRMYRRRSFEGLTSGALETVADASGPEGHSPFAYYFARAIESPERPVFDLLDVHQRVRDGVKQLATQTPRYGLLAGTPGDGGGFVFVTRAAVQSTRTRGPSSGTFDEAEAAFAEGSFDLARKLSRKACDKGLAAACHMLGRIFAEGLGIKASRMKAAMRFGRACEEGFAKACRALAELVGDTTEIGSIETLAEAAIKRDERALDEVESLYVKGCVEGDGVSCGRAASINAVKVKRAKRPIELQDKSLELWQDGCKRGDARSCFEAGAALAQKGQTRRAEGLFQEACRGSIPEACVNAAILARGEGSERKNHIRRTQSYSCSRGAGGLCSEEAPELILELRPSKKP